MRSSDALTRSDRLLSGQNLDRQLVERDGGGIDAAVLLDHALGECDIRLPERGRRVLDRVGNEGRDLDEPLLNLSQLLLEHLAHLNQFLSRVAVSPSKPGCPEPRYPLGHK